MNRLVVIWTIVIVASLVVAQGRKVHSNISLYFCYYRPKLTAMVDLYAEVNAYRSEHV